MMGDLEGMTFHSAEREVERQGDEALQEAADLRRQLERAGYEYREVQRALVEVGTAAGADDPTSPESILDALADLRRQIEHANRWRDNEILAANEARADAADLRRQLAEAQAEIAAFVAMRAAANTAIAEAAALRRQVDKLREQLLEAAFIPRFFIK